MNKTEQGVLQHNRLTSLLIHALLIMILCFTIPVSAGTSAANTAHAKKTTPQHHAFILYSADNKLHSNIIEKLSENLKLDLPDILITKISPEEKIKKTSVNNSIIIAIGSSSMKNADTQYPKMKKLFISTDPNKYRLDDRKNKNDAILYMAQSYCRQIRFIKKLNKQWKTLGLLTSKEKPIDTKTIRQCAKKHALNTYIVTTENYEYLKDDIKEVLIHADILLALPDKNIYNGKSVKNILLTSYRYRKPVIAFSKSFVNAGALASIYSSTEQIAQSAGTLIKQYFKSGQKFRKAVNYPQAFEISINRQVFRALDLDIPDLEQLKQSLNKSRKTSSGKQQ